MYARFFGLRQQPFSIAPDPRYLYMSERHREALAHLLYGVRGGGGFVLLTGEIGAGKTTVCRCFLEQIPKRCNVAYIFNPKQTVTELLRSVCDEFRIPRRPEGATVKDYVDALNEFLLHTHSVGQTSVLIIDEAQNLSADVLEQLRLLTNLETNERKLLQIVLIGQPELRTMLARPELEQLAQRVIARFHLQALTPKETVQYIRHRLAVAGMNRPLPFERDALKRIHQLSRGVPRRINLLCDRALLGAYAGNRPAVDAAIVDKAAAEVFDGTLPPETTPARPGWQRAAMAAAAVGGLALAVWAGVAYERRAAAGATAAAAPASAVALAASAPASAVAAAASAATAAASAASAAAAAVPADPKAVLASAFRSEKDAWRALATQWKLTLDDGEPCAAAAKQQLQCFRSSSTLALIRLLDRPVLLTLQPGGGKPAYALLTGLSMRQATLRTEVGLQALPLASLAEVWRGEFATLWRSPPGYADGAPVDWLSTQLAAAQGMPAPSAPTRFDAALRSRLNAFQVAQGLKPDGLAGPLTLMQINRATGVDEPQLQDER
ncbi:AAA family ATPase [Rhizobacter sp. AJA081-3]|uniref:ExeA family protein n=1 Tax=Rhizobacter sp. AJA081-3 TaxID=2753607 RepID=UPI001ADFFC99|nr:AAA family ATPase [Rhizobacter sp. AJA081-3]QTN22425.1 AAA family ATPase [Rhizobacter sp. AJA081-3]